MHLLFLLTYTKKYNQSEQKYNIYISQIDHNHKAIILILQMQFPVGTRFYRIRDLSTWGHHLINCGRDII